MISPIDISARRRTLLGRLATLLGVGLLAFTVVGFAAPGWAIDYLTVNAATATYDNVVPANSSDGYSSTTGIATDDATNFDGYAFDGTYIPEETLPSDSASVGTDVTYSDAVDPATLSSQAVTTVQNIATQDSTVVSDLHGAAYTVDNVSSWDAGTTLVGGIVTLTLTTPRSLTGTWSHESDNPGSSPPYSVAPDSNNYVTSVTELDVFVDSSLGRVVAIEPIGSSESCVAGPGHFCPQAPTLGGTP